VSVPASNPNRPPVVLAIRTVVQALPTMLPAAPQLYDPIIVTLTHGADGRRHHGFTYFRIFGTSLCAEYSRTVSNAKVAKLLLGFGNPRHHYLQQCRPRSGIRARFTTQSYLFRYHRSNCERYIYVAYVTCVTLYWKIAHYTLHITTLHPIFFAPAGNIRMQLGTKRNEVPVTGSGCSHQHQVRWDTLAGTTESWGVPAILRLRRTGHRRNMQPRPSHRQFI
jgi:hypothetical protein